jgi:hypothetical protein
MVAPKFLQITWISGIMNFYDFLGISMFRHEKGCAAADLVCKKQLRDYFK